MSKKRYPDMKLVRIQARQAERAIRCLADFGVEIITVRFRSPRPLIEVSHCPGTEHIRNSYKGQGEDSDGKFFIKVANVAGCQVEWREAR